MNTCYKKKFAAAVLAAALTALPAAMLAAETSSMVPGTPQPQETIQRIGAMGKAKTRRGVTVSDKWLRQARLGGVMLNLRLHTPVGDEVTFKERLAIRPDDTMSLHLIASERSEVITMQLDAKAIKALKRLSITEVVVADFDGYVRARYLLAELGMVHAALGLGEGEQLCVSGEDAPVTVVNEDGVRRLIHP